MDLIGQADFLVRVQHRHNDGSWGELAPERGHHDAAAHDPESDWSKGRRLYRCTTCDEEVLISSDRADQEPLGGR